MRGSYTYTKLRQRGYGRRVGGRTGRIVVVRMHETWGVSNNLKLAEVWFGGIVWCGASKPQCIRVPRRESRSGNNFWVRGSGLVALDAQGPRISVCCLVFIISTLRMFALTRSTARGGRKEGSNNPVHLQFYSVLYCIEFCQ